MNGLLLEVGDEWVNTCRSEMNGLFLEDRDEWVITRG